ncbi:MAG: galactose-1-phosphate uridylyltransferase [archaeon]
MNELRKDYLTDRWVIISSDRSKRPHDFRTEKKEESPKTCYFCPGNEHMTPPEISRVEQDSKWIIRVIPNKYPAVKPNGTPGIKTDNHFYTFASAYGRHEIVIETAEHGKELEDLPADHIKKVLDIIISRISEHMKDPEIDYVSVFKNKGRDAGASIVHSHTQIIAYNNIPSVIKHELESSYRHYVIEKRCAFCDIIAREKNSTRGVLNTRHTVAFTPYASRFPFEIWLFPTRHVAGIGELTDEELHGFADSLKTILTRLKDIGNTPYNILFHTIIDKSSNFHFHVEILPRLTVWAGFELETGTIINPVPPEDAAKFYRGEIQ